MKEFKKMMAFLTMVVIIIALTFSSLIVPVRGNLEDWYNLGWNYAQMVTLSETAGIERINEVVDIFVVLEPGRCANATREIRVISQDNKDVPCQVYNITMEEGYVRSCNIVFLANVSALSSQTYYVIYDNPYADVPVYDGLRVYEEAAGDTYNITAVKDGVEKNYARIFWKNSLNLYSDGSLVTWPGGPAGWEFSQINIASMWSDAWGNAWFGSGKSLSLMESGPIFAELRYEEAYGSDLWGLVFDYNVSTTTTVRIYYQPNMDPLVRFEKTYQIKTNLANYTIKPGVYMDFRLANSTSQAIYQNFTYNEGWFGTTTIPVETEIWKTIWLDAWAVYGWWSYNGSRTDSSDKPAANIGLIPTYSGGTVPGPGDYSLSVSQKIEDDDHHCSQWINGDYNATNGDYIQVKGYIVTYTPVDTNGYSVRHQLTIAAEWNTYGFTKGEYTIQAYVAIVPGETDTADNALIGGSIYNYTRRHKC